MAGDRSQISLSQAVLAPVNSILQAQVHAARSFLNMILQMGFPHRPVDEAGHLEDGDKQNDNLHRLEFVQEQEDSSGNIKKYKVSIPTIAALPLNPLAIEEAEVEFAMKLTETYESSLQFSDAQQRVKQKDDTFNQKKRPWYLIDEPVELKGKIAPNTGKADTSHIRIRIKMGEAEVPAELRKLIASVGDFSRAEEIGEQEKKDNS